MKSEHKEDIYIYIKKSAKNKARSKAKKIKKSKIVTANK